MALLKFVREILIRYSKWPHVLIIKSSNDYTATLIIEKSRHVKNTNVYMFLYANELYNVYYYTLYIFYYLK
jgi:hypothetical protein